MKKTLFSLTILSLFSFSNAFGDESSIPQEPEQKQQFVEKSFFYADLGVGPLPLLVPTFGLGYRYQSNHLGVDVALDASSIYYVTSVKLTPSLLCYFTPNLKSQFYTGFGLNLGCLFIPHEKPSGFLSPSFVFGKQYTNDAGMTRFFEAGIGFPTISSHATHLSSRNILWYPIAYLKYGVAF